MDDIELTVVEVPHLLPGETAYQVDPTTVMAIVVRRRVPPEGSECIAFGVAARLVSGETGESCRCVADTPLEVPEITVSIHLDMIASGQADLATDIEEAKRHAVRRVLRLRAALGCLHVLPEVPG